MPLTFSKITSNILRVISTIAVFAMLLTAILVYHASAAGLFIFLLFIVFYVQLPGCLIASFFKICLDEASSNWLISLFLGWALVVFEYFVSDIIGTSILLYAIGPAFSICYIINCFRNSKKSLSLTFNPLRVPVGLYIAAVVLLLYILLSTQFIYMNPALSDSIFVSTDKAYQMGLINAIVRGFPLANPWVSGRIVNYHIFTQILYAIPVKLFGLTSDFMIMSCSPFFTAYTLSLSFYSMFRHFCTNKERAGLYTLTIILSNMFIAKTATSSYLFRIAFINDNFGGFGVASSIACILVLDEIMKQRSEGSFNYLQWIPLIALIMLTTGIKAPIALVLVGGIIGTWLLAIIMREIDIKSIVPVSIIVVAFLFIYKFLLSGSGSSGSGGGSIFGFAKLNGICYWKSSLIDFLCSHGVPPMMRLAIIMAVYLAFFFSAFLLPFFIGYIRELVLILGKKKPFNFTRVVIYATAFVGLVMSLILRYTGHSQIYFALILIGFAPLIAYWFFEEVATDTSSKWMLFIKKLSLVIFISTLIVSSATLIKDMTSHVSNAKNHSEPTAQFNYYKSINSDEYQAMIWLKENTPSDALVSTHQYSTVSPSSYSYDNRWANCHFMYATYSNRNFFIEGSGFSLGSDEVDIRKKYIESNEKLFDPSNDNRGNDAKELGITYVVVTKSIRNLPDLDGCGYEKCFSNNSIDIYNVK